MRGGPRLILIVACEGSCAEFALTSFFPRQEDASSPEADASPGLLHSSTEDLLSIDSALQGSEYYKDLGLTGMALWSGQGSPGLCPSAGPHPCLPCPSLEDSAFHYLDADCACSCSSGSQGGFVRAEHETQEKAEAGGGRLPVLVRSMSTSRRHSWETPLSPTDARNR